MNEMPKTVPISMDLLNRITATASKFPLGDWYPIIKQMEIEIAAATKAAGSIRAVTPEAEPA